MKMKVYLIGFMASGKSTIGQELAKTLSYEFIDLDVYIENKYNKTIKQLFEINGEEYFRIIENEALREVASIEGNIVIAAGGGTSCFYNSIDFMNKTGLTIYLKVEVAELVSRLIESKIDRPLLWGKSKQELNDYIIRVLDERKKYYEKAKIIIESSKAEVPQIAQTILASLS
jgi:shikimate kinase